MIISHESPVDLLHDSLIYNDYQYCLVHLLDEIPKYQEFFMHLPDSVPIILDNSIFELGEAYDTVKYLNWIEKLQPDEFIAPDVWENSTQTMINFENFITNFKGSRFWNYKIIGVCQGENYETFKECYRFMSDKADKIAISFMYNFLLELGEGENNWQKFNSGRIHLINKLNEEGLLNHNKPHHLLGAALPQCTGNLKRMRCFESLDTSNPIVHGIHGVRYDSEKGLDTKIADKMADMMQIKVSLKMYDDIMYNIKIFRYLNT